MDHVGQVKDQLRTPVMLVALIRSEADIWLDKNLLGRLKGHFQGQASDTWN